MTMGFQCKHATRVGHRCHKKCSSHSGSRRNSAQKLSTGDEHWSKVLQANEVNANLLLSPCCSSGIVGVSGSNSASTTSSSSAANKHIVQKVCCQKAARRLSRTKSSSVSSHGSSSGRTDKDGNIFQTLYNRFVQWVNKNEERGGSGSASASASAVASGASTPCSGFRSRSSSVNGGGRAAGGSNGLSGGAGASSVGPGVIGGVVTGSGMVEDWSTATMDSEDYVQRWCSSWPSSDNSEVGSIYSGPGGVGASSACSSLTMLSSSTATSGCPSPSTPGSPTITSTPVPADFHPHFLVGSGVADSVVSGAIPNGTFGSGTGLGTSHSRHHRTASINDYNRRRNQHRRSSLAAAEAGRVMVEAMKRRHSNLTSTVSCHDPTASIVGAAAAAKRLGAGGVLDSVVAGEEGEGVGGEHGVLCATWPPMGALSSHYPVLAGSHSHENGEKDEGEDRVNGSLCLDDSVFTDNETHSNIQVEPAVKDMLGECTIPYSDLTFNKCLRSGHTHEIYTGHWHGEVMIHKYSNLDNDKISGFWQEVCRLSKIRHENITLFMGACIEPPHLAVVTGLRRGSNSLYQELHLSDSGKMNMHTRVQIARQVAQGLGYLHHKGIVAKKLNSRNIYLEPKVKLCLLDHGMPEKERDRSGHGSVPRGNLCYLAPELLSTLCVEGAQLKTQVQETMQTDVYAFGTVLYELISGHFPMKGSNPECIIWRVSIGHRQCLKHIKCNSTFKTIIAKCWKQNPLDRPLYTDINKQLQFNAALHKRHSSSEPDALNRFG